MTSRASIYLLVLLALASFSVGTARADVNLVGNPLFQLVPAGGLPYTTATGGSYDLGGNDVGNCCNPDSTTIPDWTISPFTLGAGEYVPTGTSLLPIPGGATSVAFTSGGTISQYLGTTIAGDTYTFSAWITDTGFNGENESLYIGPGGFGSIQDYATTTTTTTANGWTMVQGTYTATSSGQPLTVILFSQGGDGQQYFADVCVTTGSNCAAGAAVPEPGYYGVLFCLAGLMAAVRLRRSKRAA